MKSRAARYILGSTFAVSGLLLIVGSSAAWFVHRVNREISDSLDENLAAAQATERFVFALRDLRLHLERYSNRADVSAGDQPQLATSLERLEAAYARFVGGRTPQLSASGAVEPRLLQCRDAMKKLESSLVDFDRQPDPQIRRTDAASLAVFVTEDLLAPAEQLLDLQHQAAQENSRRNLHVADRIGVGLFLLGVCGAIAGMLIGFGIARSVHRSLVQSQQEALRNEQLAAVGQLAAGLAHEIRNPLMSMKLIVQTAAEKLGRQGFDHHGGPSPASQPWRPRDLAVLEEEITRLENMLQVFLDFARPPRLTKESLPLSELLDDALTIIRPRGDQQGVHVHIPETNPDEDWIQADKSQLRQVMLNLLLNALDALPQGGNVWIELTREDRMVAICVADDGPGISDSVLPRIFDPFLSTKTTGIGLGLSICRGIIESHGGRIAAANRPEGGAKFTVSLPRE